MEDMQVMFVLDDDFPIDDFEMLRIFLEQANCLVPGYVPPPVGFLSFDALSYAQQIEELELTILPDRNLVSRWVRIARDGRLEKRDEPNQIATHLMAFAQIMGLNIEPSLSYHELAGGRGNDEAAKDLSWLRVADNADPLEWASLALGRQEIFPSGSPVPERPGDLAFPLKRWRRDYVVALKIAKLELSELDPIERFEHLLAWMQEEFLLAGPGAIFAAMYFSPRAQKGGMFKGLRSKKEGGAIAGIKNATWDITHLSDFVNRVKTGEKDNMRFIFATADRALAKVAAMMFAINIQLPNINAVAATLEEWWPSDRALRVAATLHDQIIRVQDPARRPLFTAGTIDELIEAGERALFES